MKPLRIVQVSAYYPPHLGGQENAVQGLAVQLAEAGHDVQVITSAPEGLRGVRAEDGIDVHRLRGFTVGHAPIMPSFPAVLGRVAGKDAIVHLHIGQAFTPEMVWFLSKIRHFKYIAQLHIDFQPSGPLGVLLPLYKRLLLKRVLRSAAEVVVLNHTAFHAVREEYGYTGGITALNNGIDEAYFAIKRPSFPSKPPAVLRLLFVGRLSKQKNIKVLLKALLLTKRKVSLDLVGEGEDREIIEKMLVGHHLTNVILHGRLGRAEIMKLYAVCDALIMPSLYEAQPLVLLEALAARIPIIGTNVIGVRDLLHDVGIVVEPTVKGLAGGIEQFYVDYAKLPNLVKNGYKRAQNFRWTRILTQYERLYEEVLGD